MMMNNNRNELDLILNYLFVPDAFWFAVILLKIALWGELGGRKILCGKLGRQKIVSFISGAVPWTARPCLCCRNIIVLGDWARHGRCRGYCLVAGGSC